MDTTMYLQLIRLQEPGSGSSRCYLHCITTFNVCGYDADGYESPVWDANESEKRVTLYVKCKESGMQVMAAHPVAHLVPFLECPPISPEESLTVRLMVRGGEMLQTARVGGGTIMVQIPPDNTSRPIDANQGAMSANGRY